MALLELRGLVSGYDEVQVLRGVEMSLEEGKLTTLIGSNGAGKTTLLRTVLGLSRTWEGQVTFAGEDLTNRPAHARAQQGLALVPEGRQLFNEMTVRENLEMGAIARRARPEARRNLERVVALFPRLAERQSQKAGTLSGGEQQMLAVGRGLMAAPRILILDELSLGLSPVLVLSLFAALRALRAEGLTMLLVEQNVRLALAVSDQAYVMSEGRVVMEGEARRLAQREEIRHAYLGL